MTIFDDIGDVAISASEGAYTNVITPIWNKGKRVLKVGDNLSDLALEGLDFLNWLLQHPVLTLAVIAGVFVVVKKI